MQKTTVNTSTKCLLLSIPRELRDKIYRNILVADEALLEQDADDVMRTRERVEGGMDPDCEHTDHHYASLLDTRIIRANRQIHAEALQVLVEQNTFWAVPIGRDRAQAPKQARKIKVRSIVDQEDDLDSLVKTLTSWDVELKALHLDLNVFSTHLISGVRYRQILEPLRKVMIQDSVELMIKFYDSEWDLKDDSELSKEDKLFEKSIRAVAKLMAGEIRDEEFQWPELKEDGLGSDL